MIQEHYFRNSISFIAGILSFLITSSLLFQTTVSDLVYTPNTIMTAGKTVERLPAGRYMLMIMLCGSKGASRKMGTWCEEGERVLL